MPVGQAGCLRPAVTVGGNSACADYFRGALVVNFGSHIFRGLARAIGTGLVQGICAMGDKNPKKQMKKAAPPKKPVEAIAPLAAKPGGKAAPKPPQAKK